MTKFIFWALGIHAVAASVLLAQPVVPEGGILNAASYINPKLPNGGIAQGSIFVIFGSSLGPAALVQAPSLPLGTTLAGTSVRVSAGGQNLDCPMVYTSAGQAAAILPSNTPVGNANVTVSFNGQTSAPRSIRVLASSFGIFTLNQRGSGPGVLTNFESATSQPVNTVLKPARPGQILTLYGTGLGPLPAGTADNAAAPAVEINNMTIEVLVGSQRAAVTYAGRAPGFVGLDQINLVVPQGVSGCAVSVIVRVGMQVSNAVTIAVSSDGNVCSDPLGIPPEVLSKISAGGTGKVGVISLFRVNLELTLPFIGPQNITTDTGTAIFNEYTPQDVTASSSINALYTSIGSCIVFTGEAGEFTPDDPIQPRGLDAGPQITVNGPRGTKTLKKSAPFDGSYFETLGGGGIALPGAPPGEPPFLEPGNYTITGPGGADIGMFNAQYNIASSFTWANKAQVVNVNRATGQEITWTGGGANENIQIYGYSSSSAEENAITGYFFCLERATAQRFNIPSAVLLALPASGTAGGDGFSIPLSGMGVGLLTQERTFTAPNLDYGVTFGGNLTVKSVTFQ